MRKSKSKAAAILAIFIANAAYGQTNNVTLYGIVDAGAEVTNAGMGTKTRIVSGGLYGSRWGMRGSEDLGNGLSALFRLESGINLDDGTLGQGGRLFGREAVVGLNSDKLGSIVAGRVINTQYLAMSVIDTFFFGTTGGLVALTRSGATTQQLMPLTVTARQDNGVGYTSPNLGGLEIRAQVAAGEGSSAVGRYYGISGRYRSGPSDFVASYANQKGAFNENGRIRSTIVGGSYDLKVAKFYAGYAREQNDCEACTGALSRATGVVGGDTSVFRFLNAGVRVPLGGFTAIAQIVRISDKSEYSQATGDRDATAYTLGGQYSLSKRTTLYASFSTLDNKNGSSYAIGTGAAQQPAGSVDGDDPRVKAASFGITHFF